MCGITGFCDFTKRSTKSTLMTMTDILHHRGPDDSGYSFYRKETYDLGLGHRRLSILDLSTHGHQPMSFDEYEMVYNGEVYNFQEIREELIGHAYTFESQSDTEVILKAYHKWGIKSVNRFNGMFAIAIYDKKNNKLFLVRDRVGKKPLYYAFNKDVFMFGSELKSLMKHHSFEKIINKDALNLFMSHGYITAPHTIFEKTYKLEAGAYLEFDLSSQSFNKGEYWSIKEAFSRREISEEGEEKLIEKLDTLLTKAVEYRMISDVSIGSFLSGGYDSSLISAIMQKLSSKPIETFTIGFNEKKYNEANYAKDVSRHLKTNHHELYLPIQKSEELIFDIPKYYDEPFADPSQLPTMLLSKLAKEHVTVTLSGDGGDELFCGYGRYESILDLQKYKYTSKAYKAINSIVDLDKLFVNSNRNFLKLGHLNNDDNIVNHKYLSSSFHLKNLLKENTYMVENKYFDIMKLSSNIQEKFMLQDMTTYLPDDILVKVDRASMAYSLESRTPILDYNIVEFSMSVPHGLKYKNGDKKYLLKALTHQYIPKEIMDRPKKGFGVPIEKWLYTDLNYLIDEHLNYNFIIKQNIFQIESLQAILEGFKKHQDDSYYAKLVWHLIVFQMWYKEHML